MYQTKYFKIKELVCNLLLKFAPEEILWEMFDKDLLTFADFVRETYGITTCNTADLNNCGARVMNDPLYPQFDPHKYFRALDLHILSIDKAHAGKDRVLAYNEVRVKLQSVYGIQIKISDIHFENDISWLHIDTYNRPNQTFNRGA